MCGEHTLDWLYDSLSSPPVAGVWLEHTLDWLYDSLSSPPVAGVWLEHTLDWLYDSLSSPPVAGVWWEHTLDWLYDSLSSPPVAGVCERIHLIGSMTLSLLSTCSWCVVSAYTWLALSLSLLSTCSWCVSAYTWLALTVLVCGLYDSSPPPVAGVWWSHWRHFPVAAVASSKWMLHIGGGWGETLHMIVKCFGCTAIHN